MPAKELAFGEAALAAPDVSCSSLFIFIVCMIHGRGV